MGIEARGKFADLPVSKDCKPLEMNLYPCIWFWRKKLKHRKGTRCKVLVRGKMNSILVEFEDGFKVVTSRYAVRKYE